MDINEFYVRLADKIRLGKPDLYLEQYTELLRTMKEIDPLFDSTAFNKQVMAVKTTASKSHITLGEYDDVNRLKNSCQILTLPNRE